MNRERCCHGNHHNSKNGDKSLPIHKANNGKCVTNVRTWRRMTATLTYVQHVTPFLLLVRETAVTMIGVSSTERLWLMTHSGVRLRTQASILTHRKSVAMLFFPFLLKSGKCFWVSSLVKKTQRSEHSHNNQAVVIWVNDGWQLAELI